MAERCGLEISFGCGFETHRKRWRAEHSVGCLAPGPRNLARRVFS
jgi:hypothetical protein